MKNVGYEYTRQRLLSGYDKKTCKVVPSVATDGKTVLIAYSHNLLTGSDVGVGSYMVKSTDGGKTFSEPKKLLSLADTYEGNIRRTYSGNVYYNKTHKKWLMIGISTIYADDTCPVSIDGISVTQPIYGYADPDECEFICHMPLEFPFDFVSCYCMGQIVELPNGDMLMPFNFTTKENTKSMLVTVRYTFDGDRLRVVKAGKPLIPKDYSRGYCEPSLAALGGKYYLTIRTDEAGLYSVSDDGYNFSEPKVYVWDDKSVLENYNTQQHWIVNKNGLFLAYTRKGAHNDHVFRHRAPIFMTRFDEDRECLIKSEEIILVPELGARLGNFFAMEPCDNESWLITAEWMQSWGEELGVCDKYGSDNSLWLVKVLWKD